MVAPNPTEARNIVAPIPMKLRSNSRPIKQLAARLGHPFMGRLPRMFRKCTRGIGNDEDVVSLLNQAKSRESNTDFCQDTTATNMLG